MTEANKFLDSLKDGYDEVKLHEMVSVPKIRLQGIMQEYADKQCAIQRVTFCLLTEQDKTFEDWVHNNFDKQGNCFVNKINETVTYSQDALIDLYDFYCDRFIAN